LLKWSSSTAVKPLKTATAKLKKLQQFNMQVRHCPVGSGEPGAGAGAGAGAANTHLPVIGDFGAALPTFRAESLGLSARRLELIEASKRQSRRDWF